MSTRTLKFSIQKTSETPNALEAKVEYFSDTVQWTKNFTLEMHTDGFYRAKDEKPLDEVFDIQSGNDWHLVALGDDTTFQKDDYKKLFRNPNSDYFRNGVHFNFKGPRDRFTILDIRTRPFKSGTVKMADFIFNLKWKNGVIIRWDPQMQIKPIVGG